MPAYILIDKIEKTLCKRRTISTTTITKINDLYKVEILYYDGYVNESNIQDEIAKWVSRGSKGLQPIVGEQAVSDEESTTFTLKSSNAVISYIRNVFQEDFVNQEFFIEMRLWKEDMDILYNNNKDYNNKDVFFNDMVTDYACILDNIQ